MLLGFLGTSFGWFMTALGSAAVIIHRLGLPESTYRKVLDFMLGVSGGVSGSYVPPHHLFKSLGGAAAVAAADAAEDEGEGGGVGAKQQEL